MFLKNSVGYAMPLFYLQKTATFLSYGMVHINILD